MSDNLNPGDMVEFKNCLATEVYRLSHMVGTRMAVKKMARVSGTIGGVNFPAMFESTDGSIWPSACVDRVEEDRK